MPKIQESDYIGKQFGNLTIIRFVGKDKHYNRKVIAQCVCGKVKEFYFAGIVRPNPSSTSCGCLRDKAFGDRNRKHGLSSHPLRSVYDGIKGRCYNSNDQDYYLYGAKGVTMSDEWRDDFKKFYDWAIENGWRKGLQIDKDKIPKSLGMPALIYGAEMCSILTGNENSSYANRVHWIEYNSERMTIRQWSNRLNIEYSVLFYKLKSNDWDMTKALSMIGIRKKRKDAIK